MSRSALPGRRVDWKRAGMIPRTDVSVSAKGKRVTGTAGTSNHTTREAAPELCSRGEPRSSSRRNLHTTIGVQHLARGRPDKMKLSVKDIPPKTVAVVSAVSVTMGWLLASTLAPPVATLQTLSERRAASRPAAPAAVPAAAFTEQLHWRLQQAPVAPVPRRNPFTFGNQTRASAPNGNPARGGAPENSAAPVPEAVPVPTGPIYALAGVGSTQAADGVTFTAVLSDGNTVHRVKAGQTVGGYTVVAVTEDSATLADAQGAKTVLRLR